MALTKSGGGTQTFSGANTYAGGTTVNQGTLTVSGSGTLGSSTGALVVGHNNTTAAGTSTVLNLSTTLDTVSGSLSGAISTPTSGTNTATINTGGSGRNFTVNQTSAGTYAGVIGGDGAFTLGGSSTSTLTLSGANTYTGATTIDAGTLAINGSITSSVTVNSTGTLGGDGTITGNVSVKGGGTHAVGNSPGQQDIVGNLDYEANSLFAWDLNATNGADPGVVLNNGTYDRVDVTGNLTGIDAQFRVILGANAFTDAFWTTDKTWNNIFTATGTFTDLATIFTTVKWYEGGTDMTSSTSSIGSFTLTGSTLTWSAVPEPSSALAGLLIGAGLLRRRRSLKN